jgi:hypothetical protein
METYKLFWCKCGAFLQASSVPKHISRAWWLGNSKGHTVIPFEEK